MRDSDEAPRRLIDADGPGADLLRAAKQWRPEESARAHALAAVTAAGTAKGAGALGAIKALLGSKTGAALGATLAVTTAGAVVYETQLAPAPAPIDRAAPPPALPAPLPSVAPTAPPAPLPEPEPSATTSAPLAPRPSPSATLADELDLVSAARSALHAKDFAAALAKLDEHDRRFPQGQLGEEAQVLRIQALLASGKNERARERADAFLAAHPKSVFASRVRALRASMEGSP